MLTKPADVARAMKHYVGRVFTLKQVKNFMQYVDQPHRFYRIKPSSVVLFDAVHFPEASRREIDL